MTTTNSNWRQAEARAERHPATASASTLRTARPFPIRRGVWGALLDDTDPVTPGEQIRVIPKSGRAWITTATRTMKRISAGGTVAAPFEEEFSSVVLTTGRPVRRRR